MEVGRSHGLEPKHLVGAIANEIGLDSEYIGAIRIAEDHSVVELPAGMPASVFSVLDKAWVCGQQLKLSLLGQSEPSARRKKPSGRKRTADEGKKSRAQRKTSTGRREAVKPGRKKSPERSKTKKALKKSGKSRTGKGRRSTTARGKDT